MPITIYKEPTGIYPAYNDSYIVFGSTLPSQTYAEIKVFPLEELGAFTVFPINNQYVFNLKEFVKYRLNDRGFTRNQIDDVWGYSYAGLTISQDIEITVYNRSLEEVISRTYTFFKSAKQIGEKIHRNTKQLLNYSENGVDFNLTYFEGYPFDFTLQQVSRGDKIKIRNNNTSTESVELSATSDNAFIIVVDKVTGNWNNERFLSMLDIENKLSINVNGIPQTNLVLKKVSSQGGIYLRWLNSSGGYSYWLFDRFYKQDLKTRSFGVIQNNEFLNIGDNDLSGYNKNIGKTSLEYLTLKTRVDHNEANHLTDLLDSPKIQMYSSERPFVLGDWIDVDLKTNSFPIFSKKEINNVTVTLELPRRNTITL